MTKKQGRALARIRGSIHRSFAGSVPPGWGLAPVTRGERYQVRGDLEHPWLEGLIGEVIISTGMQMVQLRFEDEDGNNYSVPFSKLVKIEG